MAILFETQLDHKQYFAGLARQNVDFHQALGELVDNALSARRRDEVGQELNVTIEITLKETGANTVELQIADSGKGIPLQDLTDRVFNPGGQGTSTGVLNEHGFGLKNALALFTSGNQHPFALMTRSEQLPDDSWYTVAGPYSSRMEVVPGSRQKWAKDLVHLEQSTTGTKISVEVDYSYLRTIYRRNVTFENLMARLGEHLGVIHRYYIKAGNRIFLRYKPFDGEWVTKLIPAIDVPIQGTAEIHTVAFVLDAENYQAEYRRGLLDYTVKDTDAEQRLGWPYPLKIYYQGSNARCGLDVTVRDRVILTSQFESIWDMPKTVAFNRFVGELRLDARFRTTNNKTALDPHGKNWEMLLGLLRDNFKPQVTTRSHTEESLRSQLSKILKGTFTDAHLTVDQSAWDGGCEIDIFVECADPLQVRIYELRVVPSRVLDLYQLVMGWDGLVEDGVTPTHAILVAQEHSPNVKKAASVINQRSDAKGNKYRVQLKTVSELVPTL